MKGKIFIFLISFCILFSTSSTVQSATSAIENLYGGAGIAYWQAGGGWSSLINIQETGGLCALVHVVVYDQNGNLLIGFNMSLRPTDNVGIVVQGDGFNIQLLDYSDNAYGGSGPLNDYNTGPPVTIPASADLDGVQRGYISVVRTNDGCAGAGGSPSGNITGVGISLPDYLHIRSALLNPNGAFALNGTMLQGFSNIQGTIDESGDFIDVSATPNLPVGCDFNNDGDITDNFASMDDLNGADIDFAELFLTENETFIPDIACNSGGVLYKALGAYDGVYCGRFNEDPSVGSQTLLVLIAPQSNHPSAAAFARSYIATIWDDDSNWSTTSGIFNVVQGIQLFTGSVTSGEICIGTSVPLIGFTYTETALIADLYPLIKNRIAIMSLNQDHIDDAVDIIFLP